MEDVAILVFVIGTWILGIILLMILSIPILYLNWTRKKINNSIKVSHIIMSFIKLWIVSSLVSAGLWHGIGRKWQAQLWSSSTFTTGTGSFEPWTSVWYTPPTTALIVPSNEDELRTAVLTANRPLRIVGSGHSWSSTAYSTGTLIDIRLLNHVIDFSLTNTIQAQNDSNYFPASIGNITVQAGMKVQDAAQYLLARGGCFYGMGSIRNQAIGGVIAHGVHGAHPDGFNRHVVGLRVLLANGTFLQITKEEDLFMWRASIGMLGAIVEATMAVFPIPRLHFTREPILSLKYLATTIPNTIFGTATFTGFLYPSSCARNLIGYARIGRYIHSDVAIEQLNNQTDFSSRLMLHFNDHMHPAMQYIWPEFGTVVSCIEQVLASFGHSLLLSGLEEDILPNDGLIPPFYEIIDYEYMVPLTSCFTFASELLEGKFGKVLIPICLRLMRAEHSCLSMAWEDSCVFAIQMMRGNANLYLDVLAIEQRVADLGGAAHLGKVSVGNFQYYKYPCLSAFRDYRAQMDPEGIFLTPYLSMAFGLHGGYSEEFVPAKSARMDAHRRALWFSQLFWASLIIMLTIFILSYWNEIRNSNQSCHYRKVTGVESYDEFWYQT
jgi:hypothetical protein